MFIQKCKSSLICLGISGCREIFSSWPQPVETELLFVWIILFPWLLVSKTLLTQEEKSNLIVLKHELILS